MKIQYQIEKLTKGYCVRPQGQLGTCGWLNGVAWQARFFASHQGANRWVREAYCKQEQGNKS